MAEVYELLAKIGLKNEVSSGLLLISSQMMNIHGIVQKIEAGFGGWKLALGLVGGVLIGGTIIKGLEDIAKAGGAVNHQLELMKVAGMSTTEIQEALAAASKTSGSVLTTHLSENAKHIGELRSAFGDMSFLPFFEDIAKANSVLNSVKGGGQDQVWSMVKALEGKGLTFDPKEFQSYINTMTKVVEATHGTVTPEMFQQTFKYGRTATLGWDEEFVGGALPRLIQSMSTGQHGGGGGAGGPGNALMSAFGEVVSGRMSKDAAFEFEKMGLGKAKHTEGEDQANVEGLAGRDLFIKNPYEWVQKILMPALSAKGITGQNEVIEQIGKMFQVRTASSVIAEMALQGRFREGGQAPFEKDIRLNKGAMGNLPGYEELMKNDYPTILKAFNEQWKNLLETIGSPLMAPGGPVVGAMASMASAMGSLGQFVAANPESIKIMLAGMTGLAAAFLVLGGAAIVAAAAYLLPGAMVTLAIVGIASAITVMAALDWEHIKNGFNILKDSLVELSKSEWDHISSGFNQIKTAISSFIGWIESIGSWLKHITDLSNYMAASPKKGGATGGWDEDKPKPQLQNFNPSNSKQVLQPITIALNLDGRQMGQAVSEILEDLYTHPTGPPQANGWDHFRPQGNFSDT